MDSSRGVLSGTMDRFKMVSLLSLSLSVDLMLQHPFVNGVIVYFWLVSLKGHEDLL